MFHFSEECQYYASYYKVLIDQQILKKDYMYKLLHYSRVQ